jgi:hypothetical protein
MIIIDERQLSAQVDIFNHTDTPRGGYALIACSLLLDSHFRTASIPLR